MIVTRHSTSLSKRFVVFSSALVALTLVSGSGSQAQSRQALEVLNQRLLPCLNWLESSSRMPTRVAALSSVFWIAVAKASFELSLPGWACRRSPWTSSKPSPSSPC